MCACVSVIGQAVQLVLFKAPGQKERARPMGYYLICLGWDPDPCRADEEEEEIKPLAFVAGLRITEGDEGGIEGYLNS